MDSEGSVSSTARSLSDPYIIASERRSMKPFLNHLQALARLVSHAAPRADSFGVELR